MHEELLLAHLLILKLNLLNEKTLRWAGLLLLFGGVGTGAVEILNIGDLHLSDVVEVLGSANEAAFMLLLFVVTARS